MNALPDESDRALRRVVYCLLIVTSAAVMVGRIATVKSALGKTPLLSANDRSRWGTVRAIVDEGTYSLDNVLFTRSGQRDREWYTIDLVRHKGLDGREHYYSSKPPLLATLLAGEYWLVRQVTGATLANEPYYVVRLLLITTNVLPLVLYFLLLVHLVEQLDATTWSRIFVMGAATWGTFLTTFAVTINNHIPACISVLVAICASFPMFRGDDARPWRYAVAGAAAAFAVANELPALSFFAVVGLWLFWRSRLMTLVAFVPAAAVVAAGFFLTNYLAHRTWLPPSMHRGNGPIVATLSRTDRDSVAEGSLADALAKSLAAKGIHLSSQATVTAGTRQGRWVLFDPTSESRYTLVDEGSVLEVRAWENWYEYENSYWTVAKRKGVDRGEPSQATYAWHVLIGHHGVFSLTPLWLLSLLGLGIWLARGQPYLRWFAFMVSLLTVVCLGFYILLPVGDRNYGGVACGFRWMFWFTPLWLICLLPAANAISRKPAFRLLAWAMLFVSVVSASYASLNPWSHPWIFQYLSYVGWN